VPSANNAASAPVPCAGVSYIYTKYRIGAISENYGMAAWNGRRVENIVI
jgi:hypothetical protein